MGRGALRAVTVPGIAGLLSRDHAAGCRALDAALRALHGTGRARELAALHELAAAQGGGDDETAFHLTHAYVYALEAGDAARAGACRARLVAMGREEA